jgi:hypothetical protein
LLGRARERAVLDRLLDGVLEERRGGVLVVHGEAGVGKTALLEYTVATARQFRIARTFGVEAEMELPFAAVQQLCSPFFELGERLPEPHRMTPGGCGLPAGSRCSCGTTTPGRYSSRDSLSSRGRPVRSPR